MDEMERCSLMLVMDYVPGAPFFASHEPFEPPAALSTAEDIGK